MINDIHDYNTSLVGPLVCERAPVRTLGLIAQVCKAWNEAASKDEVWVKLQLFDSPTPSPQKYYTVSIIEDKLPLLRYIQNLPKEALPNYETELVSSEVSRSSTWKRFLLHSDTNLKFYDTFDHYYQVGELLKTVAKSFEACLLLNKIGFTTLSDAEAIALKTKDTFRNSYPFVILESRYSQEGNTAKALQMQQIVQNLVNTDFGGS